MARGINYTGSTLNQARKASRSKPCRLDPRARGRPLFPITPPAPVEQDPVAKANESGLVRAVKHLAASRDDVDDPELLYLSTLKATDPDGLLDHEHERWLELKAEKEDRKVRRKHERRGRGRGVEELEVELEQMAELEEYLDTHAAEGGAMGGRDTGDAIAERKRKLAAILERENLVERSPPRPSHRPSTSRRGLENPFHNAMGRKYDNMNAVGRTPSPPHPLCKAGIFGKGTPHPEDDDATSIMTAFELSQKQADCVPNQMCVETDAQTTQDVRPNVRRRSFGSGISLEQKLSNDTNAWTVRTDTCSPEAGTRSTIEDDGHTVSYAPDTLAHLADTGMAQDKGWTTLPPSAIVAKQASLAHVTLSPPPSPTPTQSLFSPSPKFDNDSNGRTGPASQLALVRHQSAADDAWMQEVQDRTGGLIGPWTGRIPTTDDGESMCETPHLDSQPSFMWPHMEGEIKVNLRGIEATHSVAPRHQQQASRLSPGHDTYETNTPQFYNTADQAAYAPQDAAYSPSERYNNSPTPYVEQYDRHEQQHQELYETYPPPSEPNTPYSA